MPHAYCSMKEVVSRVIRNTRIQDTSYIADLHEWIYEAMDLMETQQTLEGRAEELTLRFHKAKLPCGLRWIDAVMYAGRRLSEGQGARNAQDDRPASHPADSLTVFQTSVIQLPTAENHIVYHTQLEQIRGAFRHTSEYYYAEMGAINTSFSDGKITLYYRAVPTDPDGMPLIPDTQNYKQALYLYCRAMMIGSGYDDRVLSYEYCMQQFERVYAPRAIAEIRIPSPEQMQKRVWTLSRLLPGTGYYDNFFRTDRPEGYYGI